MIPKQSPADLMGEALADLIELAETADEPDLEAALTVVFHARRRREMGELSRVLLPFAKRSEARDVSRLAETN